MSTTNPARPTRLYMPYNPRSNSQGRLAQRLTREGLAYRTLSDVLLKIIPSLL